MNFEKAYDKLYKLSEEIRYKSDGFNFCRKVSDNEKIISIEIEKVRDDEPREIEDLEPEPIEAKGVIVSYEYKALGLGTKLNEIIDWINKHEDKGRNKKGS